MFKKLFGTKEFYLNIFKITLPIMLQQMLITIVGLADNVMVGQLGEDIISGVYIATKILFIVNLSVFGIVEGASIYMSQFYGAEDKEHLKQCFNFKLYVEVLLSIIAAIILVFFGKNIALLFVNECRAEIAASYLRIYSICLPFFMVGYGIASSLRETQKSFIPMFSSVIGIVVNVSLNFLFIFGLDLKSDGAAIASVIARVCEMLFLAIYVIIKKPIFYNNIFKNPKIDKLLIKPLIIKSIPLFINEFFWAAGQTILVFAYSKTGEDASSALSISQALIDLFFIAALALGSGIAISMGSTLGKGDKEEAKKHVWYFDTLTIIISLVMSTLLLVVSPFFVHFYNVSDNVRDIAVRICQIGAIFLPILSLNNSNFFIIRSGGKTGLVFAFDFGFVYLIQVPISLLLAFFTNISLEWLYFFVTGAEIIKIIIGFIMIKSGVWLRNLTVLEE